MTVVNQYSNSCVDAEIKSEYSHIMAIQLTCAGIEM